MGSALSVPPSTYAIALETLWIAPLLFVAVASGIYWRRLRRPWLFAVVGCAALYVVAAAASAWLLMNVGFGSPPERGGVWVSSLPGDVPPTTRIGAAWSFFVVLGVAILWCLKRYLANR
jgi:hypothetical protein